MADRTNQTSDIAPKPVAKATLVMLGATIVFIIIAAILIASFFRSPTGGANSRPSADSSPTGSDQRAKP